MQEHTVGTVVVDAYNRSFTITEIFTVNGKARYVATVERFGHTETVNLDWNDIRMLHVVVEYP